MAVNSTLKSILSERLQMLRRENNMTQAELAALCELPQPVVSLYEKSDNNRMPSLLGLVKLSNALNVSSDYLLGRTNDKRGAKNLFSEDNVLSQLSRRDKQVVLYVARGLLSAASEKQELMKNSRLKKHVPEGKDFSTNSSNELL